MIDRDLIVSEYRDRGELLFSLLSLAHEIESKNNFHSKIIDSGLVLCREYKFFSVPTPELSAALATLEQEFHLARESKEPPERLDAIRRAIADCVTSISEGLEKAGLIDPPS